MKLLIPSPFNFLISKFTPLTYQNKLGYTSATHIHFQKQRKQSHPQTTKFQCKANQEKKNSFNEWCNT